MCLCVCVFVYVYVSSCVCMRKRDSYFVHSCWLQLVDSECCAFVYFRRLIRPLAAKHGGKVEFGGSFQRRDRDTTIVVVAFVPVRWYLFWVAMATWLLVPS